MVPVNIDSTASVTAKGADMKRSHISSEHLCWFELVASVYRFLIWGKGNGNRKKEDVEEVLRDEEEKQSLKLHHRAPS